MRQKEVNILISYFFNKSQRLHNDVVDYMDRYHLRECDQIDHLESIIAISREQLFLEIWQDIDNLLRLSK